MPPKRRPFASRRSQQQQQPSMGLPAVAAAAGAAAATATTEAAGTAGPTTAEPSVALARSPPAAKTSAANTTTPNTTTSTRGSGRGRGGRRGGGAHGTNPPRKRIVRRGRGRRGIGDGDRDGDGDGAVPPTAAQPNVRNVVLGNLSMRAWYPSFYPAELVGGGGGGGGGEAGGTATTAVTERLYVCCWCFKYSRELMPWLGHMKRCALREEGPPGRLVYRGGGYAIYEVDGEVHRLYTQNLSLFAKLFLDTKSVFYDVTTFLYYLLVADDPSPAVPGNVGGSSSVATHHDPSAPSTTATTTAQPHPQVIGFFSKEKMSWDNNNLACILVFPPWQRKGLGQLLQGASYVLAKREGRLGGPEKPLSELGAMSYRRFWEGAVARYLLAQPPGVAKVTVRTISEATFILPEDVVGVLEGMVACGVLERTAQPPPPPTPALPSASSSKAGTKGGKGKKRKVDDEEGEEAEAEEGLVVKRQRLLRWAEERGVDLKGPVDLEGFVSPSEGSRGSVEEEDEEEEEED